MATATVLVLAAWPKLTRPDEAILAVAAFRIVPPGLVEVVGIALPWLELAAAFLLVVGVATRPVAALVSLLMLGFAAGVVWVWSQGYSIDCGCFGGGGDVAPEGKTGRYLGYIGRDVGFAALAALAAVLPKSACSVDGLLRSRLDPAAAAPGGPGVVDATREGDLPRRSTDGV